MAMHFSHRHPLCPTESKEDEAVICSGCELDLSGQSYKCTKPNCDFHLHDLCYNLPQQILHNSHPNHPLLLLPTPPYKDREFACNACSDFGSSFIYHCRRCQFDLHVQCATLPDSVKVKNHEHPLVLFFSFPKKGSDHCNVCDEVFPQGCWAYYCRYCDFGAHLDCATGLDHDDDDDNIDDDDEEEEKCAEEIIV